MSDDVTIPREDARKWAGALRAAFAQLGGNAPLVLIGLADLLDPPPVSLRDEVAEIVRTKNSGHRGSYYDEQANVILAVVRKHVAADSIPGSIHGKEIMYRDDVLALLGGESDD